MKNNHTLFLYLIFAGVIILLGMAFLRKPEEQPRTENNKMPEITSPGTGSTPPAPTPTAQENTASETKKVNYNVVLKTSAGDITLLLNGIDTPITAGNFVKLANSGFYNNTVFHRTIKGFMIQGGDPKGDGTGGPGYKFNDEPFEGEYTRGTIAMANAGPNTNGSQFFIMHQDYQLPKNYVIFGKVTSGLEVVDAIATAPVTMSPMGENSKPVTPAKVLSIEVTEAN